MKSFCLLLRQQQQAQPNIPQPDTKSTDGSGKTTTTKDTEKPPAAFSEFCNVFVQKNHYECHQYVNLGLLPSCRISPHWGGPTTQAQSVKMLKVRLCRLPATWFSKPCTGLALLLLLTFCTCKHKDSQKADMFAPWLVCSRQQREEQWQRDKGRLIQLTWCWEKCDHRILDAVKPRLQLPFFTMAPSISGVYCFLGVFLFVVFFVSFF